MTYSLRQRHQIVVVGLTLVVPFSFMSGIGLRKPPATQSNHFVSAGSNYGPVIRTNFATWTRQGITTRLRRNNDGALTVELDWNDLNEPDLLLYWVPGEAGQLEELPPEARLLGAAMVNFPLRFPEELRGLAGTLILYSLADHEIAARSKAFALKQT